MDSASLLKSFILNNEGVALLSQGQSDEAAVEFTRSLGILRPLVHQCEGDVESAAATTTTTTTTMDTEIHARLSCVAPSSNDRSVPPSPQARASQHSTHPRSSPSHHRDSETELNHPKRRKVDKMTDSGVKRLPLEEDDRCQSSSLGVLFRDPIEIPIHTIMIAKSAPSHHLLVKLSIVTLYNLALSFHISAIRKKSTDQLSRARRLYEYAFQMHLEENCDVTLLFSLALLNNLGLIYKQIGEQEKSTKCFVNMLSTMMFLLDASEAQNIKQWDNLLSNVSGLILHDIVAPAA